MILADSMGILDLGGGTFLVSAESDLAAPTYYWWLDGHYLAETRRPSTIVSVEPGSHPVIEVFDDAARRPDYAVPSARQLVFGRVPDAARYKVEQFIDGAWELQDVVSESGALFKRRTTGQLADETDTQFRVTPVGTNEVEGTPAAATIRMIRYPDPPNVTFTYNAGPHTVTIAAA